jgi:hypothetical protein
VFRFLREPFRDPFATGHLHGDRATARFASHGLGLVSRAAEERVHELHAADAELPYLYSFVGSTKNAGRARAACHAHSPARSRAGYRRRFRAGAARADERDEEREYRRRFAEATRSSKFVLCPRGISVSSIRVFETMSMGRVPVILSDDWVPPPGPAWEKFSLRVRESDWADIPRILEEREREAVAMGNLARAEWLDWFSEEAAFHRVIEWCLAIKRRRRVPESLARWPVYLQFLRPFHLRRIVGGKLRKLRRGRI